MEAEAYMTEFCGLTIPHESHSWNRVTSPDISWDTGPGAKTVEFETLVCPGRRRKR
jgi:hypothetical protein